MVWTFTQRSDERLKDIHPDLAKVPRRALSLSPVDFVVIEGGRSQARQCALMSIGASRTLRSRIILDEAKKFCDEESSNRGLTLSGTKTHVKKYLSPLALLLFQASEDLVYSGNGVLFGCIPQRCCL